MSEGNKKNKRKIEHWELVSLLLMVYDFIAILVSYLVSLQTLKISLLSSGLALGMAT